MSEVLMFYHHRYHVVDNRTRGDGTQVKELIRKLEWMVQEKRGHLEVDPLVLLDLEAEAERRSKDRRKKQRQMEVQTHRDIIRTSVSGERSARPITEGLAGVTGLAQHLMSLWLTFRLLLVQVTVSRSRTFTLTCPSPRSLGVYRSSASSCWGSGKPERVLLGTPSWAEGGSSRRAP